MSFERWFMISVDIYEQQHTWIGPRKENSRSDFHTSRFLRGVSCWWIRQFDAIGRFCLLSMFFFSSATVGYTWSSCLMWRGQIIGMWEPQSWGLSSSYPCTWLLSKACLFCCICPLISRDSIGLQEKHQGNTLCVLDLSINICLGLQSQLYFCCVFRIRSTGTISGLHIFNHLPSCSQLCQLCRAWKARHENPWKP